MGLGEGGGRPTCDSASVTVRTSGRRRSLTASNNAARQADLSQYGEGAGPCLSALTDGRAVAVADYGRGERWPAVTRAARRYGIRSPCRRCRCATTSRCSVHSHDSPPAQPAGAEERDEQSEDDDQQDDDQNQANDTAGTHVHLLVS